MLIFPTNWNDAITGTPEEQARTIASGLHHFAELNRGRIAPPCPEWQAFMIGLVSRAISDEHNARTQALAPDLAAELDAARRKANALELEATAARNRYVEARNGELQLHERAKATVAGRGRA